MPQPFQNAILTNAGASLLARLQAGEVQIEFTRVVIGNGVYTEEEKTRESLEVMNALKSEKNSYSISFLDNLENSIRLKALITNQDPSTKEILVNEGFYINEIGLYAKEKDGDVSTEILYSMTVAIAEGEYMPAYNGSYPAEIIQDYVVSIDNADMVTIQMGTGAVFLVEDLPVLMESIYNDMPIITNSNTVTEEGMGLDAIQANPNIENSMGAKINAAIRLVDFGVNSAADNCIENGYQHRNDWTNTPSGTGALYVYTDGMFIRQTFCASTYNMFYERTSVDEGASWRPWVRSTKHKFVFTVPFATGWTVDSNAGFIYHTFAAFGANLITDLGNHSAYVVSSSIYAATDAEKDIQSRITTASVIGGNQGIIRLEGTDIPTEDFTFEMVVG